MVRLLRFYQSSVGKKVVVAVTGAIMYGFIIGHMLGNLKAFAGPAPLISTLKCSGNRAGLHRARNLPGSSGSC